MGTTGDRCQNKLLPIKEPLCNSISLISLFEDENLPRFELELQVRMPQRRISSFDYRYYS